MCSNKQQRIFILTNKQTKLSAAEFDLKIIN